MGEEYCRRVRELILLADDKVMHELRYLPEIEALTISPLSHLTDEGLSQVEKLKKLKFLSIKPGGRRISNDGLSCLGQLTELRGLRLEGLAVDDTLLDVIATLPQLRHVEIKQTLITPEGIELLRETLPDTDVKFRW